MGELDGKQLARTCFEVVSELGVDAIAPFTRLPIGVFPVPEGTARQKVVLNIGESSLHVRGPVGVPFFMSLKLESVSVGKGRHLRHRHHSAAGPLQHHYGGIVDHADSAGSPRVLESIGKKDLAIEASEGRRKL